MTHLGGGIGILVKESVLLQEVGTTPTAPTALTTPTTPTVMNEKECDTEI
jgi:hypothetical protein